MITGRRHRGLIALSLSGVVLIVFLAIGATVLAQELPKKIRGYKVQPIPVSVMPDERPPASPGKPTAELSVTGVELATYNIAGLTFRIPIELRPFGGAGKVDFVSFKDFTVNGTPVEIEEFRESFRFSDGEPIRLPAPVSVFIRTDRAAAAAWDELTSRKDKWVVSGRAFVFGRFRKYGFSFKRVIPIDVRLEIANPLRSALPSLQIETCL